MRDPASSGQPVRADRGAGRLHTFLHTFGVGLGGRNRRVYARRTGPGHAHACLWSELGLQTASLTIQLLFVNLDRRFDERMACLAGGQSSSGGKMCGAAHALQIGIAASRSPRG